MKKFFYENKEKFLQRLVKGFHYFNFWDFLALTSGALVGLFFSMDIELFYKVWMIYIIMCASFAFYFVMNKRKQKFILLILFIPAIIIYFSFEIDYINDVIFSIIHKEQDVIMLLPDFESETEKEGRKFSDEIYSQITRNDEFSYKIKNGKDTFINIKIRIDRIEKNLSYQELLQRGKKRLDDFGICGQLKLGLKNGKKSYYIENFKLIIIDEDLKKILEVPDSSLCIYQYGTTDIGFIKELVNPVNYIKNLAINFQLIKIADKELDIERKNKILKIIDKNFLDIASPIRKPALTAFHEGNSYFRVAFLDQGIDTIIDKNIKVLNNYKLAEKAYNKAFDAIPTDTNKSLFKLDKSLFYYNRGTTYYNIFLLKREKDDKYLELAEDDLTKSATQNLTYDNVYQLTTVLNKKLSITAKRNILLLKPQVINFEKWIKVLIDLIRKKDWKPAIKEKEIIGSISILNDWKAKLN
jgi:hypothetical protein